MLRISIDDAKKEYCPGESLVGRVHYTVHKPQYVEIRVSLQGEEFTYYTSSARVCQTDLSRQCLSKFLETKYIMIQKGDLGVGDYEFPFKATLPTRLPSTYVGKNGHVKFLLKAYMDNHIEERTEDEMEFKVFSPIDLNGVDSALLAPNTYSTDVTIPRWFCTYEEIEMEVELQKNAFVLGEVMKVLVLIKNNSHLHLPQFSIKLLKTITPKIFASQDSYLTAYTVLASDKGMSISPYRKKSFLFYMKIPDDADIPNFEMCSFFNCSTFLEVTAVIPDSTNSVLRVKAGIVLGHVSVNGQNIVPKIQGLVNQVRDKLSTPSTPTAIITPLDIGMTKAISSSVTASVKKTVPQSAPYPTDFDLGMFLHEPVSQKNSLDQVSQFSEMPMPVNPPYPITEHTNKQSIYPPETSSSLSSYPPYMTSDTNSNNCPYPTVDSSNPPYPSGSSLPYPPQNSCPYPTKASPFSEERLRSSRLSNRSSSSVEAEILSQFTSKGFDTSTPPYQPVKNPPYPTGAGLPMHLLPGTEKVKPPRLSNRSSSSVESEVLPYPHQFKDKPQFTSKSFDTGTPCPPMNNPPYPMGAGLPMPLLPGTEEVNPPYPVHPKVSRNVSTPPYPVLENISRPSKPPYPTGDSTGYPPEESTNMPMPMPMPSRFTPVAGGSIGFAVPTTAPHSQSTRPESLHDEIEPSAPLIPSTPERTVVTSPNFEALIEQIPTSSTTSTEELTSYLDEEIDKAPPPSYDEVASPIKSKKERPRRRAVLERKVAVPEI